MELRDVIPADLDRILELNNAAGPGIVEIGPERLRLLEREAHYFRVALIDGGIAGFLVAFEPGARYDSPNYQWFSERYGQQGFVYIDRVVVGPGCRRHGVGRVMYADLLSYAEIRQPMLTTEVFIEPRDDIAMVFFTTQNFREVGQQSLPNGRRVSLMSKELEPYAYVHEHYLAKPDNPAPPQWWSSRRVDDQVRSHA
jgi:predicted GNAT superfamily acetyltransferase